MAMWVTRSLLSGIQNLTLHFEKNNCHLDQCAHISKIWKPLYKRLLYRVICLDTCQKAEAVGLIREGNTVPCLQFSIYISEMLYFCCYWCYVSLYIWLTLLLTQKDETTL